MYIQLYLRPERKMPVPGNPQPGATLYIRLLERCGVFELQSWGRVGPQTQYPTYPGTAKILVLLVSVSSDDV